jgi:hypothetical protein
MATLRRTQSLAPSPRSDVAAVNALAAPPQLLRCLVVSPCAERRRLIRAAAESQAWDAILCRDAGEFLRAAFKRLVPLMVVDLPPRDSKHYGELREATDRARQATNSLLVIAGADGESTDEIWARKLGVWGYLSEANSQRGFELIFSEARRAVERSETVESAALVCVEEDGW